MLRKKYSKYKAKPVKQDGNYFASKLEFRLHNNLLLLQKTGEINYFLRQVPFHLPGKVKYIVDYQVFYKNGEVKYLDAKGYETPVFKMKKKMVEDLYPIKIEIIKRA
jgi:hypothetical protein